MARKKKSRKIGQIGVRKTPDFKRVEKDKRIKKSLGKPAGNRNSLVDPAKDSNKIKANRDPRLGSKKPVDLYASAEEITRIKAKPVIRHFSPESELAQIESDEKLAQLINELDAGKILEKSEQAYVNVNLTRHKELCKILGIDEDESDVERATLPLDEDDLYDMFEKIDVNKLNNF